MMGAVLEGFNPAVPDAELPELPVLLEVGGFWPRVPPTGPPGGITVLGTSLAAAVKASRVLLLPAALVGREWS
jgi:hypothetical protein